MKGEKKREKGEKMTCQERRKITVIRERLEGQCEHQRGKRG